MRKVLAKIKRTFTEEKWWHYTWLWIPAFLLYIADYGQSTTRLIRWFFYFAIFFGFLYFLFPSLVFSLSEINEFTIEDGLQLHIKELSLVERAFRAGYFSIVTMTTLGFGDMHANPGNLLSYVFLSFQVLLGYVLLGMLITRLSVIFHSK